jgi:hypothetical protein
MGEPVELEYRALLDKYDRDLARFVRMTDEAADDAADGMGDGAKKGGDAWKRSLNAVTTIATGAGAALVGIAASVGAAFAAEATEVQRIREEILGLAQTTNLLPETLSAIETAGGDEVLGKIGEAAGELNKRLSDAVRGTGELLPYVRELGIDLLDTNGQLRSTDSLFREIVTTAQRMESPLERSAFLTAALGGAGREVNAALGSTELEDWIDHADNYGTNVGPTAQRATAAWSTETQLLQKVTRSFIDDFTVGFLGSEGVIEAVQRFTTGFTSGVAFVESIATDALPALANLDGTVMGYVRAAKAAASTDFDAVLKRAQLSATQAGLAVNNLRKDMEEAASVSDTLGESTAQSFKAPPAKQKDLIAEFFAEYAEGQKTVTEVQQSIARATSEVDAITTSAVMSQLEGADAINARYDQQLTRLLELKGQLASFEAFEQARAELQKARTKELTDFEVAEAQRAEAMIAGAADRANAEKVAQARFGLDAIITATDAMTSIVDGLFQRQIENAKEGSAEQKRLLRAQFAAQKATAIANAAINTAVGITNVWASFAAAPPVAAALTAVVAAAGAVQIGLIASQKPTFDIGGMIGHGSRAPDQHDIRVRDNEAVLNSVGVHAIGGPDGVARANGGHAPAGGGSFVVALGHRVFDEQTRQSQASPFSPASRAGRRAGGGRQRIGHR